MSHHLNRLAESIAIAGIRNMGLPLDEANAKTVAELSYQAARTLIEQGERASAAAKRNARGKSEAPSGGVDEALQALGLIRNARKVRKPPRVRR